MDTAIFIRVYEQKWSSLFGHGNKYICWTKEVSHACHQSQTQRVFIAHPYTNKPNTS